MNIYKLEGVAASNNNLDGSNIITVGGGEYVGGESEYRSLRRIND